MRKVSSGGNSVSGLINLGILDTPNALMALAATAGNALSQNQCSEKLFYHYVDCLRPTMAPIKELKGPVGEEKILGLRIKVVLYAIFYLPNIFHLRSNNAAGTSESYNRC